MFSEVGDIKSSTYEVLVVDEEGKELRLDSRAVEPVLPAYFHGYVAKELLRNKSGRKLKITSEYMLSEAKNYRDKFESNQSKSYFIEYPRYQHGYKWNKKILSNYNEFVNLRIYKERKKLSENNKFELKSRILVYELF